ncbi:hypothetical protein ACLMJK_009552 [Lecanora helva]
MSTDHESPVANATDSAASSETEKAEDAEEITYMGHMKFSIIFTALCLSVFQVALDEVIVATAVPTITNQFNSLADVGWYASAYLFTDCSFQLLFGKLYAIASVKLVYLVALAILELGSIICATAPNSIAFIIGRAIAGLGAGGILSGVLTILSNSVPREKLALPNGLVGAVSGIAFICGPLIGGAIISSTTWRWIFWMNPILSAPTFIIVVFLVHLKPPASSTMKQKIIKLDLPAFAIFLVSIVSLLLALQWGGTEYSWKNARIIVLVVLSGLAMIVFASVEIRKKDRALVPLKIITQRSIAFGILFSFCTSGAGFILEYYLPLWLQAVKSLSVIASAVRLLPVIIAAIVCTIVSGILAPIIGYYVPFMVLATIFLSLGMGLLTTLHFNSPMRYVLGYQVPGGLGLGLALQQTVLAAQTILPIADVPIGVSLIVLAQTLGGTVSLSAADTIFTTSLSSSIAKSVPQVDQSSVLNSGATSLQKSVPAQYLDAVLLHYNEAVVKTWYLAVALACTSIIGVAGMEWKRIQSTANEKTKSDEDIGAESQGAEDKDLNLAVDRSTPNESGSIDPKKE